MFFLDSKKKVVLKFWFSSLFLLLLIGCSGDDKSAYNMTEDEGISVSVKLFQHGDVEKSLTLLKGLANKYPRNSEILYKLGVLKIFVHSEGFEGDIPVNKATEDGLYFLGKAVEMSPGNIDYLSKYAVVASSMKKDKIAVATFKKIFTADDNRVDPKYKNIVTNYSLSLERLGMEIEGLSELETSLQATNYDEFISSRYIAALSHAKGVDKAEEFLDFYMNLKGKPDSVSIVMCSLFEYEGEVSKAEGCYLKYKKN